MLNRPTLFHSRHQRMTDSHAADHIQSVSHVEKDTEGCIGLSSSLTHTLTHTQSIDSLDLSDKTAVNAIWSQFAGAPGPLRQLILQGLLSICCPSQLSFLSELLKAECRIDPVACLPKEIALKILGLLDAASLCRATQVSRLWHALADDDALWRKMCQQHIERKCDRCGWGLPLMERTRRTRLRSRETSPTPSRRLLLEAAAGAQQQPQPQPQLQFQAQPAASADDILPPLPPDAQAPGAPESAPPPPPVRTQRTDASTSSNGPPPPPPGFETGSGRSSPAGGFSPLRRQPFPSTESQTAPVLSLTRRPKRDREGRVLSPTGSPAQSPPAELSESEAAVWACSSKTRPWKSVYSERLIIERNWRKGSCAVQVFSGHTDAVTCLQVEENLPHPSFPVLMTGSWDRSVRIWNLETGETVGVLRGHERGIRALQFDANKLITVRSRPLLPFLLSSFLNVGALKGFHGLHTEDLELAHRRSAPHSHRPHRRRHLLDRGEEHHCLWLSGQHHPRLGL